MITHIASHAASCTTGNFVQQWQCKWNAGMHQPANAVVVRSGYDFGHNIVPILVVAVFLFLALRFARSRKSAPAASRR